MNTRVHRLNAAIAITWLVTLVIWLLGNAMVLPPYVSADSSGCSLQIISGEVEVLDSGSYTWRGISNTVFLKAGDSVQTAKGSSALIIFLDGSSMELGPETYVRIQQADGTTDNAAITILNQFWGRTWNRVIKMINPRSEYEIDTPSCHASVRGTHFMIDVKETGLTTVQTVEGLVAVQAQNREVLVQSGYSVTVDRGNTVSTPGKSQLQDTGSRLDNSKNGSNESDVSNNDKNSNGDNSGGMVIVIAISMVIAIAIVVVIKVLPH